MGFSMDVSVPVATVFLQGLVSFFSPCVFPLIPLYISYLSGGTSKKGADGTVLYDRKKVILHTLFFILGVSFAFFVLGFGFSALGQFFKSNQLMFARIGGALVFIFGLYQLGILGTSNVMGREHRLPFKLDSLAMSPVTAFAMGFTFSFAWTPCVGPALASVLLMTASASTTAMGFMLIGVYTLGFVLPFLAVGLFTTKLLELFKKHRGVVKYTVKAGGVLMIAMGLMMFTGKMNSVTGYLSQISTEQIAKSEAAQPQSPQPDAQEPETMPENAEISKNEENMVGESVPDSKKARTKETTAAETKAPREENTLPAIDFTLTDQYGNTHTLSDYKGKTIFLNFWATWCPPCRAEMPDIQKLYETYDTEGDDALIILGVASPNIGGETSEEGVKKFLEENGYTYPVLMDTTGEQFMNYGVFSYPTTFMIDRDGNVFGYASGQLSEDMMKSIIEQTMEGKRKS
ncbi:MAG: redoxin family protein [Clostridium sp.]|nr:redoxin family protein [Clostridium sp.]